MSPKPPPDIRAPPTKYVTQKAAKAMNTPLLVVLVAGFATLTFFASSFLAGASGSFGRVFTSSNNLDYTGPPVNAQEVLNRCAALKATPFVSETFRSRKSSERYEYGNNATLIRDATIFTGKDNGTEIIHGDILLEKGIVRGIGRIPARVIDEAENLTVIEAHGAWVTPGLGEVLNIAQRPTSNS